MDVVGNLLRGARGRARAANLQFSLTKADIIVPAVCPVLGIVLGMGTKYGRDGSPSIDRINNSLGYVPDNIIVVSWRANRLKSDATPDELKAIAAFYDKVSAHVT